MSIVWTEATVINGVNVDAKLDSVEQDVNMVPQLIVVEEFTV